jgi:cytochrome P450
MTCPVTGSNPPDGARIVLDPLVRDLAGESAALRAAGPLVEVELPGGVPVWAVTRHAEARALLTDPRLVKDIAHWDAFTRGEIPADWPLIGLANPGRSMLTVDGEDHRRLRGLVAQALTPRRVEHLRKRIEELTGELLDRVAEAAGRSEVIDLKAEFAYLLPMYVVGELMGIDEADLPRLKVLFEKFFSTQTPPEEVLATLGELAAMMATT